MNLQQLTYIKTVLELLLLVVFLTLLLHIARKDGRARALSLLTNVP